MITIFWFRQDLRLDDNPGLTEAARRGEVIPLYIHSPTEEGRWAPGGASRWWLHHSLERLDSALRERGSRLIIRHGESTRVLNELATQTRAGGVFWSRRYEPAAVERDMAVKASLRERGLRVESFKSNLLFEPWEITTKEGRPYKVFTPFWKTCLAQDSIEMAHSAPTLSSPATWPDSLELDALRLLPRIDWAGGMRATWSPGESGARRELEQFLADAVGGYAELRDFPARRGTSRLSPHLHFGEIGPRRVWHTAMNHLNQPRSSGGGQHQGTEKFLAELGWREFAHHVLFHFPHTAESPLREEFARFPWRESADDLAAWKRGRTGYPIVDAGMRELWTTGWMHNRVRMIVASFLTKHLLHSWQHGAAWFWDTLVDADLANNTLGWQWTSGCGADAAPYFRIFNPIMQGEKFDADGAYVRTWIPELCDLPNRYLHNPWTAPPEVLQRLGIRLGHDYPMRIVDHAEARARALDALSRISPSKAAASTVDG